MWLIKDNRTKKVYRCKFNIENDQLRDLCDDPFIKGGVLSVAETLSDMRCIDKFPFIEVLGKVDGRTKGAKEHKWFTWLIVIDKH